MSFLEGEGFYQLFDFLWKQDVLVRPIENFDEVEGIIQGSGKSYITPMGSPDRSLLTGENALWLGAFRGDEVLMLGAARLEDLGSETVAGYWPRLIKWGYGETDFEFAAPRLQYDLGSRLVYFGDLYSCAGGMNHRNVRAFTAIGHIMVQEKWNPDSVYAFIRDRDIERGAAGKYGFTDSEPVPFLWPSAPKPRSPSEWCCYRPRHKLGAVVARTVQAISAE